MYLPRSNSVLWHLVSAGTLLTVIGLAGITPAHGQQRYQQGGFSGGVRKTAFNSPASKFASDDDDDVILQVLEEDMATPPAPPATAEQGEPPAGFKEAGKEDAPPAADAPPVPWTFMDLFKDDSGANYWKDKGYTLGGWSTFGYSSNNDGAFTGNGAALTNSSKNMFIAKQQYLYLEKKADIKKDWDWGYRGDLMYGGDGYQGQSFGNSPGRFDFQNGFDHGVYAFAIPQLYGEISKKDLSVKIGHLFTPTGYEVIPPAANFFYSHQITWNNAEAFYHTGAMGTWNATEKLVITGGWFLGWDTGFDQFNRGQMGYVGIAYTFNEDKTVLSTFNTFGNQGWRGNGTLSGAILSHKWTDRFMTVNQFDVLNTDGLTDFGPNTFQTTGTTAKSFSFLTYVYYDITKDQKWRAAYRQELWDADGTAYQTHTWGVNYKPHPNLILRPELRYLYAPGAQSGPPGSIADNIQQTYKSNLVFGFDVVMTF